MSAGSSQIRNPGAFEPGRVPTAQHDFRIVACRLPLEVLAASRIALEGMIPPREILAQTALD
jgi:hypothetical protein